MGVPGLWPDGMHNKMDYNKDYYKKTKQKVVIGCLVNFKMLYILAIKICVAVYIFVLGTIIHTL